MAPERHSCTILCPGIEGKGWPCQPVEQTGSLAANSPFGLATSKLPRSWLRYAWFSSMLAFLRAFALSFPWRSARRAGFGLWLCHAFLLSGSTLQKKLNKQEKSPRQRYLLGLVTYFWYAV